MYDERGEIVLEHLGYAEVDKAYASVRDMEYDAKVQKDRILNREKYGL